MHERRFNPSQAHKLEAPERKQYLPPVEIVTALRLLPGWDVADIGAGSGYFTLPIADAVGRNGRVFAVDVEPEMLSRIRAKVAEADLSNVQCVEGEASSTGLPAGSCDCVFYANVWHELDDHSATLAEALRILKPSGRIAILDWRSDVDPDLGPPLNHRIAVETVRQSLVSAGFAANGEPWNGRHSWLTVGERR